MKKETFEDFDYSGATDYAKGRYRELKDRCDMAQADIRQWGFFIDDFRLFRTYRDYSAPEIYIIYTEYTAAVNRYNAARGALEGFEWALRELTDRNEDIAHSEFNKFLENFFLSLYRGNIEESDWEKFEQEIPEGAYERLMNGVKYANRGSKLYSDDNDYAYALSSFIKESYYMAFAFRRDANFYDFRNELLGSENYA